MKTYYLLIISLFFFASPVYSQTIDILTGITGEPNRITSNGTHLYFSTQAGVISYFDISEDTPTSTTIVSGFSDLGGVAIYGDELYFANFWGNSIMKVNLTEMSPEPVTVVPDLWGPNCLTIKNNELYFTESSNNRVSKIDLTSDSAVQETVVEDLYYPSGIAIHGDDLYIAEISGDRIMKVELSTGDTSPEPFASGLDGPIGIRIHGDELFIAVYLEDRIVKVNLVEDSPTYEDVVTGLSGPTDITFLGDDLYICENVGQKISKLENVISGTEDLDLTIINLFPNPAHDYITVSPVEESTFYSIFSSDGKLVKAGEVRSNGMINISTLSPGKYAIRLNNSFVHKIIKM